MNRVVEHPKTKQLYFDGEYTFFDFDGTPIAKPDVTGWKVVATNVPYANEWYTNPGSYGTYNAVASIVVFIGDDRESFTMGGSLAFITNWIENAQANCDAVSYIWQGAYSCRNRARTLAEVQV